LIKLKTIGKILMGIGLAIIFFGGFIMVAAILNQQAGFSVIVALAAGFMLIVFIGLPVSIIGLIIYLVDVYFLGGKYKYE